MDVREDTMGDIGDIVKTVEQGIAAGDFQITGKPTMSTDGVPEAHGVQPGEEDARDKALDADPAAAGPPRPAPPSGPKATYRRRSPLTSVTTATSSSRVTCASLGAD